MACERVPNYHKPDYNKGHNDDCILDILKNIVKAQKFSFKDDDCVTCTGPLMTQAYDTRPVMITLQDDSKLTAYLDVFSDKTRLFRVEDLKGDCVLLRLLDTTSGCVKPTNLTITLRVDCICAIQCFQPEKLGIKPKDQCGF